MRFCIPWAVVLDIVFLNLLDVVVRLGVVHALGAGVTVSKDLLHYSFPDDYLLFPCKVPGEAQEREHEAHEPEDRTREEARDDVAQLLAKARLRREEGV